MNKKEYFKMLEKADKQGEKDIKESRKKIEEFIDESKKALIVINEKGVITIGNRITVMSSVAQAFSNWMSQYIFSKDDIEYMIEVAEKANNFFEGKADTKEIINKLEELKEMLEMENE